MKDLGILLPILGLLFVVWVSIFLIFGETWQNSAALIPVSVGSLIYYEYLPWSWILFLPFLSILVLNVNAVLSKPKFNGLAYYINYIIILPFALIYLFHVKEIFKTDGVFKSIFSGACMLLLLIVISKLFVSDVILLFVNQLYAKDVNDLETKITHRFIKGTGRTKSFYVTINQLGAVETSGFFYFYVGFKNITSNDVVCIRLRKGCLGTEYISGFPKIISRGVL